MAKPTNDVSKFIYSPKVVYEITINPDDKHQCAGKGDSRVTGVKAFIEDILKDKNSDILYHMFPEMSMPQFGNSSKNRYSRVHYHGIISFRTHSAVRYFLLNLWHKLTGSNSIQLNPYRPDHWPDYCRKQQDMFQKKERICSATWLSVIPK